LRRLRRLAGNFDLNAVIPIIIKNLACTKLRQYCIEGTRLHRKQVDTSVERSLMLITVLSPVVAYAVPGPWKGQMKMADATTAPEGS
jgi:fumarate hydratase class II